MELDIQKNKEEFLNLVNSIQREFDKERLINWLNKSDFFTAPASTKYHRCCAGGLCDHALNVYYILKSLNTTMGTKIEEDSLKIVALFSDISKANFYELYKRNVKNEITGQWEQVEEYRVRDPKQRFIYGNHEQTSEYIISSFMPLTVEEKVAILHHMGGTSYDSTQTDVSVVFSKYPLAVLVHTADLLSTYILENE